MIARNGKTGESGMTLIEVVVVIVIMALLMGAVERLVRTTWISWIHADRRVEIVGTGRPAMDKMVNEFRSSYQVYSITDSRYFDYYPQWATTTVYRFFYDSTNQTKDLYYGTGTPVFASMTLAAPIDSFSYTDYTRRLDTAITTRARRVNSMRFVFDVSDERRLLPSPPTVQKGLNPMTFRSRSQRRMSPEGYMIAKSSAFASESYKFSNANDNFCIKIFNDRVEFNATDVAEVEVWRVGGGGFDVLLGLQYNEAGDYWATCCRINTCCVAGECIGTGVSTNVNWRLSDVANFEWSDVRDQIWIQ